jgi:hypothetical protein
MGVNGCEIITQFRLSRFPHFPTSALAIAAATKLPTPTPFLHFFLAFFLINGYNKSARKRARPVLSTPTMP